MLEHIEHGAAKVSALKSCNKRGFIDDFPARHIDDNSATVEQRQPLGTDQSIGFRNGRSCGDQHVATTKCVIQLLWTCYALDKWRFRVTDLSADRGHTHAESVRPVGDFSTDCP